MAEREPRLDVLASAIAARGIALDQPWVGILYDVPARAKTAFERLGLRTLGEVVEVVQARSLRLGHNLGLKSITRVYEAVEALASSRDAPRLPAGGPATVGRLVSWCLADLRRDDRALLTAKLLRGSTLQSIGRERGLTKERIRQKIDKVVSRLNVRFGATARELLGPLLDAMDRSGGLVHHDTVRELLGERDLRRVYFALIVAGAADWRLWHGEFLVSLPYPEILDRLRSLRRRLRAPGVGEFDIAEVGRLAVDAAGLRLDRRTIERVLVAHLGCRVSGSTVVVRGLSRAERIVEMMRRARRPVRVDEIVAALRPLRPPAPELRTRRAAAENVVLDAERFLRNCQFDERRRLGIVCCGKRTFIHETALPLPAERLNAIVDWCVRRMHARRVMVTTRHLVRELSAAGLGHPFLNEYVLADLLACRPEVVRVHKFRMVHVAWRRRYRLTLAEQIEAVLRKAPRPLTVEEVRRRLSDGTEYPLSAVGIRLYSSPLVLNLGGRFRHMDATGLTAAERGRIVRLAVARLPRDGSPLPCRILLDGLRHTVAGRRLARRPDAPAILRGLLVRSVKGLRRERSARLVARPDPTAPPLVESVVAAVVRDLGVASLSDARQALVERYDFRLEESTLERALNSCARKGVLRRLSGQVYCRPSLDEAAVLDALSRP
ncbi:MAG: hypothetical protein QME96_14265 [Myxococcota bacterium]|nr:hypothetical protein [Myxococcota bacterium]